MPPSPGAAGPGSHILESPVDLETLAALHAETTQGAWTIYPGIHQDTKVVLDGRGLFGVIADVSTAPADYDRANAAFIVAAHTIVPALIAELAAARRQLAAR